MAAATEVPPVSHLRLDDEGEFPPMTQKFDWKETKYGKNLTLLHLNYFSAGSIICTRLFLLIGGHNKKKRNRQEWDAAAYLLYFGIISVDIWSFIQFYFFFAIVNWEIYKL